MASVTNTLIMLAAVTVIFNIASPFLSTQSNGAFFFTGNLSDSSTPANQTSIFAASCNLALNSTQINTGNSPCDFPINDMIVNSIVVVLGVAGIVGVLTFVGLFQFPNPYTFFGALFLSFFAQFTLLPYATFISLPYPVNMVLIVLYSTILIWGLFELYHASGEG